MDAGTSEGRKPSTPPPAREPVVPEGTGWPATREAEFSAKQLADALTKALTSARSTAPTAPSGPSPEQQDLVVRFRAMRNGLGNFGRHGETRDDVLRPAVTVTPVAGGQLELTLGERTVRGDVDKLIIRHPDGSTSTYEASQLAGNKLTEKLDKQVVTVELVDRNSNVVGIAVTDPNPAVNRSQAGR